MSESRLRSELQDIEREIERLDEKISDIDHQFWKNHNNPSVGGVFALVTGRIDSHQENKVKQHEDKMRSMNSDLRDLRNRRDRIRSELDNLTWQKD